jgi:(4S)-4-hydroxy-5-phosphonooxypentane-2,3-dione isomerase
MSVAIVVIWYPKDGAADTTQELLLTMQERTRLEPGCEAYQVHRTDDDRFVLYERYVDAAAIEAHHATSHYQELVQGKGLALVERREITRCTPL